MQHHFYAYMARMKLIKRWGLRHNTREENDQEHSLQVTMIAHALAMYKNRRYGGSVDVEKVLLYALYHEAAEVITGDLASPIKYFNPGIRDAYKEIERMASEKLLEYPVSYTHLDVYKRQPWAMALAESMAEPPPTASTKSTFSRRISSMPS